MQNEQDGRTDFDFFIGRWKAHNRRLRERLKDCHDWEEFDGEVVDRRLLGGLGNMDEVIMNREAGRAEGITLRLFDPKSQEWSLYWSASTTGTLELPMIGKFANGRGEFFAQEVFENQHVYSRFTWCDITENSCRWEQAFSADGGKTWETNWIADFTRLE